jgi:hypothetical protein
MRAHADVDACQVTAVMCVVWRWALLIPLISNLSRILDTVHLGLVMHAVYWYTVSQYGDFQSLNSLVWHALSLYALCAWLIVRQEFDHSDRRGGACSLFGLPA